MKSYFLERLGEVPFVRSELSKLLPHQVDPWLLNAGDKDPVAYLSVAACDDGTSYIQVDMSGRHFDQDELVVQVLRQLQGQLGSVIRDDSDDEL
ncbi:hypothetical protein C8D77_105321 [Mesorhizobium loti]|uniref:Uncharacterized protein n=1 Tax=Rhizobium loti TaxID=381 RepID=A0A8E2WDP8_RHILI|nr:hypothetical protein [Mesorhizobium loti]PWJ90426.1 hypothetical protein C8D77_105321 [Mesorhizobium loti]